MQWKTLSILFVTYLCIYFVRKPLSVVKAPMQDALGLSTSAIAGIESVFLGAYAIGQFILPSLGDRLGAKNMLVAGYVVSAAACLGFGMTSVPLLLAATWAVNGFAQSLAHPLHVKVLTPWFKSSERGTAIGIWNTSQQVGGVVSTALAAFVLGIAGWRTAVVAPAVFVFISAGILAMTTLNPPWTEKERTVDSVDEGEEALPSMMEVLRIPKLPMLMVSYFFVKIVRYCLIFWLPFYLAKEIGMAAATAGYLSCVFDIGGVLGGIISGIICDKYFNGRRTIAGAGMCVFLTAAILAYQTASGMGMLVNAAVMGLVGFFVAGPDSMLGATAIADCVEDAGYGSEVLGTATGLVNGAGSVGAVFQGALTAYVAEAYGWGALFCTLALFSAISVVTLMLAVPDKKKGGGASAAVTA